MEQGEYVAMRSSSLCVAVVWSRRGTMVMMSGQINIIQAGTVAALPTRKWFTEYRSGKQMQKSASLFYIDVSLHCGEWKTCSKMPTLSKRMQREMCENVAWIITLKMPNVSKVYSRYKVNCICTTDSRIYVPMCRAIRWEVIGWTSQFIVTKKKDPGLVPVILTDGRWTGCFTAVKTCVYTVSSKPCWIIIFLQVEILFILTILGRLALGRKGITITTCKQCAFLWTTCKC
jgi:hypothetical protein